MGHPKISFKGLLFGTAGIPLSTSKRTTENGIKQVRSLGLDAMELEFVRKVNVKEKTALKIREVAENERVVLTCHAPYYINLNSKENDKFEASKKRIYDSARITSICGGWSVCFHAAYYRGDNPLAVYKRVKGALEEVIEGLEARGIKIWIRPETTGKPSQFGELEEILGLSRELEPVMPTVDFAHLHARTIGKMNSSKEFIWVLDMIEKELGREGLENMHIHISGIEFGEKGEKKHVDLEESDFKYVELLRALKEYEVKGVVISESPNIEKDSKLMKKIYESI